jgi:signal peptidase I
MVESKEPVPIVTGPENEEYLSLSALFFEMVKVIALAIVIIIPIRVFLFQPFFVQGASMEPNFEDGEYLIINEFGYKHTEIPGVGTVEQFRDLDRQDVVVFRYPKNPEQYYIKRVIALPGESVAIKDGIVYIFNEVHHQGYALDESAYLAKNVKTSDMTKITLDEDEYFVMGDNRSFSYDSRAFGPIHRKDLIGRVLLRAWPVSRASLY